jgi:hypothetical protein
MFAELYDALSFLFSWRWPEAVGEVTEVDVECIKHRVSDIETWRLAVAYKFSLGIDGPYAGESFWAPAFFGKRGSWRLGTRFEFISR